MNPHDVPMPPQIAALEQDARGFPKFFVILPPPGRELHFRVLNYENVLTCGTRRLCAICGLRLPYWLWFVGSVQDAEERRFPMAPMHRDCLEYSLAVCPFLSGHYEPKHNLPAGQFEHSPLVETHKLDRMALYCTRSYTVSIVRGQPVFRPAPATALEFRDENGHPLEEATQ